jgi:methylmalonyl-CoA/ethylmalonyl-CoA epimerase
MSQSVVATSFSDGVMNLTLLQFRNQEDAGDERGPNFEGLHHFGIWVDDLEETKRAIEAHGGHYHPAPGGHAPANAEHNFRDPNGTFFDVPTHEWDGAQR